MRNFCSFCMEEVELFENFTELKVYWHIKEDYIYYYKMSIDSYAGIKKDLNLSLKVVKDIIKRLEEAGLVKKVSCNGYALPIYEKKLQESDAMLEVERDKQEEEKNKMIFDILKQEWQRRINDTNASEIESNPSDIEDSDNDFKKNINTIWDKL